jgi:tetratricopeptide (TPR) repeat protein
VFSQDWAVGLLLIALTALAYIPAWNGAAIWDDDRHMTRPELRTFGGLAQIWVNPSATQQYYPVVHTVFWIEHKIWGDAVFPYHFVNILLHALSALILLKILRQLNVPGAWLGAALFALHPVQVESVAWISELKNTLSGAFCLAAALTYLRFDETRERRSYVAALVFFLLGLLSKTAIAPLPVVLAVVLWWKRGRVDSKRDIAPLLPFVGLGAGAGLLTAWLEQHYVGAQGTAFSFSFIERCLIAGRDFWFYLFKLFWPAKLTFIYPRWQISGAVWWQYLFPLALILLLAVLWQLRKNFRAPLAAALVFLGLLFPALGFINVYPFIYSFVADHFQYLACVGPLTLVAAGITMALNSAAPEKIFLRPTLSTVILLTLGLLSWRQCRDYRDIETLWRTTIARNPDCWMAYSNLGSFLSARGNVDEAIRDFRKALELWPDQSRDHNNLGKALVQKGRIAEAMDHFQTALRISHDDPDTETNIGAALLQQGDVDGAISHLQRAVEKWPRHAQAHINLGDALLQKRETDAAIAEYGKTLDLPFDHAETLYSIGNALRQKGDVEEAIIQYRTAIGLRPDFANAHNNLANSLRQTGRIEEAVHEYEAALKSEPGFILAQNNLAWLLATSSNASIRDGAKAVRLAEQALRSSGGNDPIILHTLAAAYAENRQFPEAVEAAQRALELADTNGITSLAESLRSKLALYQAGSPYHETSATQ